MSLLGQDDFEPTPKLTEQEQKIQDADRLRGGEIGGKDGTVNPATPNGLGTGDEIHFFAAMQNSSAPSV